ncbi:MAG: YicC family protein [Clostridia bacterium]|nr:YicC family protein [Clostridia bacterium]
MIKSMTGYGKAISAEHERNYQIEIKSINHRYLDISIKMPKKLSYLEEIIKREVSSKIKRGKVDIFVTFENNSVEGREIKIDTELASAYIKELKKLAEKEKILSDIQVNDIANYPDVLKIENNQDDEIIKNEILDVLNIATNNLIDMRKIEGEKLAVDIIGRIDIIKSKVKEISEYSTGLIEEYVVKLEERIKQVLKDQIIEQARLAQEVVIYADKCSVEEEITRLNSHICQLENLIKTNEPVGKKLDFIIQEMNRETNTIGSKANNLEITNRVIDIKTEIENIREQVQNIE